MHRGHYACLGRGDPREDRAAGRVASSEQRQGRISMDGVVLISLGRAAKMRQAAAHARARDVCESASAIGR